MELNNVLVMGVLTLIVGGSGVSGILLGRWQAAKIRSETNHLDVDADAIEAKVQPEIETLVVDNLNKGIVTLSAENERMSNRLQAMETTIQLQQRTIGEQAITIDKQNDTITDYRRQVAALTEKLSAAEVMLNEVRVQLNALQSAHPPG